MNVASIKQHRKIRLAIVDDSAFVRKAFQRLMEEDEEIRIVGVAASGEELLKSLNRWRPDIITLDLHMPGMGGLETLDRIVQTTSIPVIVLSSHAARNAPLTLEALHRGAVDFIDKQQYSLMDFSSLYKVLKEKILAIIGAAPVLHPAIESPRAPVLPSSREARKIEFEAIVIGASTGGPPALQKILEGLRRPPSVPVAIVQHMPPGFTKAMAERLNSHLPFTVREASDHEPFEPGTVYLAPAGYHLKMKREKEQIFLVLDREPADAQHIPSVDVLFQSALQIYGSRVLAVLLTGMGRDGAQGMVELAAAGAYTIAESEESCVVYGMPRAAVELGGVQEILKLEQIPKRLSELLQENKIP